MKISAFELGSRFIGVSEVKGVSSEPLVLAMLRLDYSWPAGDDVAWCSAYTNFVAWLLRLPRSKDLRARSWLAVGEGIHLANARAEFDVVVIGRGSTPYPPADVIDAPGHVGFFAGRDGDNVLILGGNQGDKVSISPFPASAVLGIRRLYTES